jgi:hypothetical protein
MRSMVTPKGVVAHVPLRRHEKAIQPKFSAQA